MIEISAERIEEIAAVMHGIPGGTEKVLANAVNRGISKAKTESGRRIRSTYRIGSADSAGRMTVRRASTQSLAGAIEYAGAVIPLIKFNVRPNTRSSPAAASVLKANAAKSLGSAYVTSLGRGTAVFERETRQRASSRQLYGPSLAHMAENEHVLLYAEQAAQKTVEERIEHEITRILNGYGG